MTQLNWDEYRDSLGFMSGKKHPTQPEANAVLFSAQERILRNKLYDWSISNQINLHDAIEANLIIDPGLLKRPIPWSQDQESIDDYIALCSVNSRCAGRALLYGKRHFYKWKIFKFRYQYNKSKSETDVTGWLGRFPSLIAHMEWASRLSPSYWRQLWWCLSVSFSGRAGQHDPFVLNWIMVETEGGKHWYTRLAAKMFWKRLRKHWPGGLAELFKDYFKDAEHPIAVACERLKL